MKSSWSQESLCESIHICSPCPPWPIVPGTELAYIVHVSLVSMEVIAALNMEEGHDENFGHTMCTSS